jgi:Outer membrane efflux protein
MKTSSAVLLACALAATSAQAAQLSQLSLQDSLSAAQQRLPGTTERDTQIPYKSSAWLAALPSFSVSYLASDENQGTDETELSLNLPIKSSSAFKRDRELASLTDQIQAAELTRRRLYLSGLIREAIWARRIARTEANYAARKIQLLEGLLERQQSLFDAHSASRYSLLSIEQELTDARIRQQEFTWEAEDWQERYRLITGLGSLPETITEDAGEAALHYEQHPQLQLLELGWRRRSAIIEINSASGTPWNVSLTAKQLDNPQLDENQYGLAVEIPLSVFDLDTEALRTDWQQGARDYWQARDELYLELQRSWDRLQREANYLQRRQQLLDEAVQISSGLTDEARTLAGQNELGQEIWVRRLVADIDNQAVAAINQLRIEQNRAMTRQAAGIPL